MNQQGSQSVLSEELLQKHGLKLTLQQVANAQDGQVVNGCLVLKKEEYQARKFQKRADFVAVLATRLRKVPANMFYKATNLRTVVMPEAEEIVDGENEEEGAFAQTPVANCYFPKMKRVGSFAFVNCPIVALDQKNFPVLEEVGDGAFAECLIASVNLPSLVSVGDGGFMFCKLLKQLSAEQLQEVGDNCFSYCPLLFSINCQLEPEMITCSFYNDVAEECCDECGACPVCYHDIEVCLQRGKSNEEHDAEIDEKTIDEVLNKFRVGITVQQALSAAEGQIINDCLVLKEEHYQTEAFKERKDFKSVLALRLRHVAQNMFEHSKNLTAAIMPEAVGVMCGSFNNTELKNGFFPKLAAAGEMAFRYCKFREINSESFPALETIGESGFSYCPVSLVHLPSLISVGNAGFSYCKRLKSFSAGKLQEIGENCFSYCPLLSSVNCDIEPKQFVCNEQNDRECEECIVCFNEVQLCLSRGKSYQKIDVLIDEKAIDRVLKKFQVGITVQQALDADEGQIINGCLILKEEHYESRAFQCRNQFKSVLALQLRHVSFCMFNCAQNLTTAIMPEAVGAMGSCFQNVGLQNGFFPKLHKTGDSAFSNTKLQELNSESFPALESICRSGFSYCPTIRFVSLPNLLSVGETGFSDCKNLLHFQAAKLRGIGANCFTNCLNLSSISCNLESKKFTCWGCDGCPICRKELSGCMNRGAAPTKLFAVQSRQNRLLAHRLRLLGEKLSQLEKNCKVEQELQIVWRCIEDLIELGLQ